MQQIHFSQQDFLRFSMIGNTTDVPGIKHNWWRGMEIRPLISGGILLTYTSDGWAIKDLIKSLEYNNYNSLYDSIMSDSSCFLTVTIFKIGSLFKKIYVANINLIFDEREFYFGSIAKKSLDDLIYHISETINGGYKPAHSTEAAIQIS